MNKQKLFKHSTCMLKYYTSKIPQKQVKMYTFSLFVKNDNFYVNIIMSTKVAEN